MNLDLINSFPNSQAHAAFLRCCGARRWADRMTARRPFGSKADLLAAAEQIWQALPRADWLEAFAAHPEIGDLQALRSRFATTAEWAAKEQAQVAQAPEATLQALAQGNRQYQAKFGYLFLVCASGKTADEMLALLEERLQNAPEAELYLAALEQEKITRLRLEKLDA
jgi:2-oxo-4-hydroxy-4-carboxy-5-ureidoimidazoline decarboxylase